MKIIIDELTENIRIDCYLAEMLKDISRSKIQENIKNGNITVNSKVIKSSYNLKISDCLEFDENSFVNMPKILAENTDLDIIWEDENMAVINKPSGMLTHPTTIETSGTLVNAVLYKYGDNLSDINGDYRRGIVHRLDRNTSGLIMIAKNNKTHNYLVEKMKEKIFKKTYRAIVKGIVEKDLFEINSPIGRHPTQPHKMAVRTDGKECLSIVKVIERYKDATSVEVNLITGRTHQIRVHLSSIGHPVYNDTLYGFGKPKIKTQEQVLQSCKLEFIKPFTENRILLEIEPDEKYKKVVRFLTETTKNA